MYREMRELSRAAAIDRLYQEMGSKHRARFRSIQVSWNESLNVLSSMNDETDYHGHVFRSSG